METIEFYAHPTEKMNGLELTVEMDSHNPLLVSPQDQEQLDRDWTERGYTRSSPIGTLFDVSFNEQTGETRLRYRLTEYKIYSGIAFPALPDTEEKLSQQLRNSMRASAVGCAVETTDGKIVVQRRKEGLIDGGRLDSGAAGMMVYNPSTEKLDWQEQIREKLARELRISDRFQIRSVTPTAVFSSRGPAYVPAAKGYFAGAYSGMVGSRAAVNFSYDRVRGIFDAKEVGEVLGVDKNDLAAFIVERTTKDNRGLCSDGCAALLSALPAAEFYDTVEKINSRETARIRFGYLRDGKFTER